jgi:hypothetical protein
LLARFPPPPPAARRPPPSAPAEALQLGHRCAPKGAQPAHLGVREVTQDGATTVITADVGGDGLNGPSHFSFEVRGDRVARMTIRA